MLHMISRQGKLALSTTHNILKGGRINKKVIGSRDLINQTNGKYNRYGVDLLSQRLYMAKGKRISSSARVGKDIHPPVPCTDEGWVTIKLGDSKKKSQSNSNDDILEDSSPAVGSPSDSMDDRLLEAQQWVSRKLSREESAILDRSLGIEDELTKFEEEGAAAGPGRGKPLRTSKMKNRNSGNAAAGGGGVNSRGGSPRILSSLSDKAFQDAARLKGFLEINPFICSGCGAAFQSKTPDTPGFLPGEKFAEHRIRAEAIREKQEAIKILEMAGIELDSSAAEEILADAQVKPDIIAGIRSLGRLQQQQQPQQQEEEEEEHQQLGQQRKENLNSGHSILPAVHEMGGEISDISQRYAGIVGAESLLKHIQEPPQSKGQILDFATTTERKLKADLISSGSSSSSSSQGEENG